MSKPAAFFLLGLLIIFSNALNAQLDSVHWLPPCHAAGEYGEHYLYLTTPEIEEVHISIILGNGQFAIEVNGDILNDVIISNAAPQRIFLGTSFQAGGDIVTLTSKAELNQAISHKGLILTSDKVFYVNYRVRSGLQGASLTSKGENAIGQDFRIGHIPGAYDANVPSAFQRSNFISIMSTQDNTEVEITDIDPDVSFENATGRIRSGGSVQISLNKGESYVASAYYGTGWPAVNAMGLMGARVTSNHPIAINCGSWLGSPFNYSNQDIGIDQIVPIEYTGKEYVLVRGDGPIELETPIAIAISDNTEISINGIGPITTLNAGDYYIISESEYTTNQNIYVKGSKAFYMYQSLAGANDRRTGGLNFIPPLGCSSEKSINNIMDIDLIGNTSFQGKLFIVTETGENLWINDNIVPDAFLLPLMGNGDYKTFKSPSLSGLVDVTSTGAIQVGIFGRNNAAGWAGYFSGFKKAIPPQVKVNNSMSCDGLLFLDIKEDAHRIEWYHNNVVIDTINDTIRAILPGQYYVIAYNQVCDALHVDTSEIVVIQPPLDYALSTQNIPCTESKDGYIQFDSLMGGYPPYKISIDDGKSFSSLTFFDSVPSGTHFILVVDDNGCEYRDTVQIENLGLNPHINFEIPDTITCFSPTIDILTTGSSRGQNLKYIWSSDSLFTNNFDTSVSTQTGGLFSLEITDLSNGCSSIDSVEVIKDADIPDLNIVGNEDLTCTTQSISLWATSSLSASNSRYLWKSLDGLVIEDSTKAQINLSVPGKYQIMLTNDRNGCRTDSIVTVGIDTIRPELFIASPDTLTCVKTETQLKGSLLNNRVYALIWTTNDGEIISGNTGLQPLISQPGTYRLSVQDSINGCKDSIDIVVVQDTVRPIIDLGEDFTLTCKDSLYTINAFTQNCEDCIESWETLFGPQIVDPNQIDQVFIDSGTYVLHTRDQSNGCTSSDTIKIEKAPSLEAMIVTAKQGNCDERFGSIQIDSVIGGIEPFSFSIDGGANYTHTFSILDLSPGKYNIQVKDANDCILDHPSQLFIPEKMKILSIQDLNLILGQNARFQVDINLSLDKVSEIIWSPQDDLSCSDCLDPEVLAIKSAIYRIIVKDIYGCEDVADIRLNVARKLDVFIPNVFTPTGDLINDGFTGFVKKGQAKKIKRLQIFSRWGELMFETTEVPINQPDFGWDGNFNGKKSNPGVYVYVIEIEFIDDSIEVYYGDVTLVR